MTDLYTLALRHVPSALRDQAEDVADLLQLGMRPGEVATQLGIPRQRVGEMQSRLREGMVKALAADGYTPKETINYLAVPTAMVTQHLEDEAA